MLQILHFLATISYIYQKDSHVAQEADSAAQCARVQEETKQTSTTIGEHKVLTYFPSKQS